MIYTFTLAHHSMQCVCATTMTSLHAILLNFHMSLSLAWVVPPFLVDWGSHGQGHPHTQARPLFALQYLTTIKGICIGLPPKAAQRQTAESHAFQ